MTIAGDKAPAGDRPMWGVPAGPWIRTFAWWPRFTFDAGTVWLRPVWKRHCFLKPSLDHQGGSEFWFQYRRFAP